MRITFPRLCITSVLSLALMLAMHWTGRAASAVDDGNVRVTKSAYTADETIAHAKRGVTAPIVSPIASR